MCPFFLYLFSLHIWYVWENGQISIMTYLLIYLVRCLMDTKYNTNICWIREQFRQSHPWLSLHWFLLSFSSIVVMSWLKLDLSVDGCGWRSCIQESIAQELVVQRAPRQRKAEEVTVVRLDLRSPMIWEGSKVKEIVPTKQNEVDPNWLASIYDILSLWRIILTHFNLFQLFRNFD
jgi:hypothetical protein